MHPHRIAYASQLLGTLLLLTIPTAALARETTVKTPAELTAALAAAQAGDRIVLQSGTYAFDTSLRCEANATQAAPIEVVSETPLGAKLRFNALEGFKVNGAHWHFDGLEVRGVCAKDDDCEHAFHVGGGGSGFSLRRSQLVDFNAQIKVNANPIAGGWAIPHDGLIEGNEFFDTRARSTGNPTNKVNIDTGDRWVVRANYIHDFQNAGGNGVSYGAFMKSGGKSGVFERNLVMCSKAFTGGTRIGLSFGGGGTAPQFCAPAFNANTACDPEHTGGILRNNIVANCSDVAIYLNRAKDTQVLFNTLIETTGVDFRFPSSTGIAVGNVLDGKIRGREQGTFTGSENLENFGMFTQLYQEPRSGDLRAKGSLAALLGKGTARADLINDYCIRQRSAPYDLGALQASLGDCTTLPPPLGAPGNPPVLGIDAGSVPGNDAGADAQPAAAPPPPAAESGGCGCSTPASQASPCAAAWLVAACIGIARKRRKRA